MNGKATKITIRQGRWNRCHAAPPAELACLFEPYALRKGSYTPDAQTLDACQPRRFWRSPGRRGNSLLSQDSDSHFPRAGKRGLYRQGGRESVLFAGSLENENVATYMDALLEQQISHERLGEAEKKLDQPVHKVHLWSARGIQKCTSDFREYATGITLYTCGALFLNLQVSFCTPLLLSHPLPNRNDRYEP